MLVFSALLSGYADSRFAPALSAWAFWLLNCFDRHGLGTGRWYTYYDDGRTGPALLNTAASQCERFSTTTRQASSTAPKPTAKKAIVK